MERKLFIVTLLLFLLAGHASAQGWMVYKKDGTKAIYYYTEVDSIVTFPASSAPSGAVAVDLGLPSGTKWANINIGASSPEDYGDYYAWGETETKSEYSWDTYMVTSSSACGTSSDPIYAAGLSDIAGSKYDVAHVAWGGIWKMPTSTQVDEILSKCTWTWTTQNGVNGYRVTGTNGNSIFLPAAGYRFGTSLSDAGSGGRYWSSTRLASNAYGASGLYFNSDRQYGSSGSRYYGRSVRPVAE